MRNSPWFVVIVAIFVTCLITANIIAVKLVSIFGLMVPAAVIIFPISYISGDRHVISCWGRRYMTIRLNIS